MGVLYARVAGKWVPISANAAMPVLEGTWTLVQSTGTLGNSTVDARYQRIGQWVKFSIFIAFGSTFNGGVNTQMTYNPPFPPAQQTAITSKLYTPTTGQDWGGSGYVADTRIAPLFPKAYNDTTLGGMRNTDASGSPGTGCPLTPGNYPCANPGSLLIEGHYRIADGY